MGEYADMALDDALNGYWDGHYDEDYDGWFGRRRFRKGNRNLTKKRDTVYMHGKVYWAKIFGAPRTNYNEDGREWAFEFEPDEAGRELLVKEYKLKDRLKDKYKKDGDIRAGYEHRDNEFIILKRKEFDYEGEPNEHIRVVDAANQPWNPKVELGNETEVDVKLQIVDYGAGKKKGIYPVAIRVLELVPFVRNDFAPLAETDERVRKAKEAYRGPSVEEDFGMTDEDDTPSEASETPETEDDLDDDMPAE